jgi:hypothetical protein
MESSMKDLEKILVFSKLGGPLNNTVPYARGPLGDLSMLTMVGTITIIMQGKYCQKFVGKMNENTFINCLRLF